MNGERIAVVLFNLGGPDQPEAIQPFLFNLFNDPAIIGLPGPLRWMLARLISTRRATVARGIYAQIGGSSPLLAMTQDQALALERALAPVGQVRCFIAMRYWHPLTEEAVEAVRNWRPDRIVLLPLYPQYSRTTTGSSLDAWDKAANKAGLAMKTSRIRCYPTEPGMIAAQAFLIEACLAKLEEPASARVLFSAHGLPKSVIDAGDPYQRQIEMTAQAVASRLGGDLDWGICYQSRVGPKEWIGPSTEEEILRAGKEGKSLVVVPIAFVSEHSETLVELDIDYARLAKEAGVPIYLRVSALACEPRFIDGLAALVRTSLHGEEPKGT